MFTFTKDIFRSFTNKMMNNAARVGCKVAGTRQTDLWMMKNYALATGFFKEHSKSNTSLALYLQNVWDVSGKCEELSHNVYFEKIWDHGSSPILGDIYKGAKSKTNICTPLELFIG